MTILFYSYPFNSLLSRDDYLLMEAKIKNAFEKLKSDSELGGSYYPLQGLAMTLIVLEFGNLFTKSSVSNLKWRFVIHFKIYRND